MRILTICALLVCFLPGCASNARHSTPYSADKLPYCRGVWISQGRGVWYCIERETFERWRERNEL